MNTNLPSLISTYHRLKQDHDELLLATIIETTGSTYRKAGARMLITREDSFFGLLGGGCFEADLLAHAKQVFKTGTSRLVFYDMRAPEDEIWGLGLGCNGAVRILMELVRSHDDVHALALIDRALARKERHVLLTVCESEHPGWRQGDSTLIGIKDGVPTDLPDDLPLAVREAVQRSCHSGTNLFAAHEVDGRNVSFFSCEIKPPFHLLIIGAGPDAAPVIRFSRELGWEITLVDYREAFLGQEDFRESVNKVLSIPDELSGKLALDRLDAIVLMTHKIEYDERYLRQLTGTSARYIGLLGPAARRDRLLESLGTSGQDIRDRIFGPVGLDIGGELPEEIALSLVAEIQAVLYQRDGKPLHDKSTPLHGENAVSRDGLHAVILAAGGAKRFGGLKQLLEYEGNSLLRRSVQSAQQVVGGRVTVVLGARARKVMRDIENADAAIVCNNDWESGMASSLRVGIADLPESCSAILLVLCDQALITAEQLEQLCRYWLKDGTRIVASAYAGTVGTPAIIPRSFFAAVMALQGDRGAKSIIELNASEVDTVSIPEAEFDIDTEADYLSLLSTQDVH